VKNGEPVNGIASVASFFVSRIDAAIDAQLDALIKAGGASARQASALLGRIAIANAKIAYRHYQSVVAEPRWQVLANAGARPQRLLWASTSTKNPAYRDVVYVEELIGPNTVNTLPPATLKAFRDHGRVRASLIEKQFEAKDALAELEALGISIDKTTASLLQDGVRQFEEAFEKLLAAVGTAVNPR